MPSILVLLIPASGWIGRARSDHRKAASTCGASSTKNSISTFGEARKTRVLIAFEDEYHVYQSAIASAIHTQRPHVEVASIEEIDALEDEVARFDPHLVICSRPNTAAPNGRPAWVELPPDPEQLTEICLDGQRSKSVTPALKELLRLIDETEKLAQRKQELGNCQDQKTDVA